MVTLVWGGGEGVLGEGSPPRLVFNYSKEALGGGGGAALPGGGGGSAPAAGTVPPPPHALSKLRKSPKSIRSLRLL